MKLLLAPATVLLVAACGGQGTVSSSGGHGSPAPVRTCQGAHFPFPPAALKLGAADGGRRFAVHTGDLVEVALLGSQAPAGRWPEITVTGSSLQPLVNPANAATVGTQLGEYCAVGTGSSTLTSASWNVAVNVGR